MFARTFDPTSLSETQSKQFRELLERENGLLFPTQIYKVHTEPTNSNSVEEEIKSKYQIIPRKNKKGELRYEVVQEILGEGGQGVVATVGTLIPQPNGSLKYKSATKFSQQAYVLKIESLPYDEQERNETIATRKMIAQRVPHLFAKEPFVIQDSPSAFLLVTISRRFPGEMLENVLGDNRLTTELRFALTQLIAQQLQEIHDLGIIHRDIKPENIIVDIDFANQRVKSIHFIDFDFAKLASEQDKWACGTRGYVDPEFEKTEISTEKSDVYSLGKTFEKLWKRDSNNFGMASLIKNMTKKNREERIDLPTAIKAIYEAQYNFINKSKPSADLSSQAADPVKSGNEAADLARTELKTEASQFQKGEYKDNKDYLQTIINVILKHADEVSPAALKYYLSGLGLKSLTSITNHHELRDHLMDLQQTFVSQFNDLVKISGDPDSELQATANYVLSKLSKCITLDDYQRFNVFSVVELKKEEKNIQLDSKLIEDIPSKDKDSVLLHLISNIQKIRESQDLDTLKAYFDHIETKYQFLREERGGFKIFQTHGSTKSWQRLISEIQSAAFALAKDKDFVVTPDQDQFLQRIFKEKTARINPDRSKEESYAKMKQVLDSKLSYNR